jgi:hypothetical protein
VHKKIRRIVLRRNCIDKRFNRALSGHKMQNHRPSGIEIFLGNFKRKPEFTFFRGYLSVATNTLLVKTLKPYPAFPHSLEKRSPIKCFLSRAKILSYLLISSFA